MDVFYSALRGNELIDGSKAVQMALRKFNMDLQDETVADAVSIIPGLATIVGDIKEAGEKLSEQRYKAEAERAEVKNVMPSVVKKQLLTTLNEKLIPLLYASLLQDKEKYQPMVDAVNDIIERYNNLVKVHRRVKPNTNETK